MFNIAVMYWLSRACWILGHLLFIHLRPVCDPVSCQWWRILNLLYLVENLKLLEAPGTTSLSVTDTANLRSTVTTVLRGVCDIECLACNLGA